jgi:hypothetical protein
LPADRYYANKFGSGAQGIHGFAGLAEHFEKEKAKARQKEKEDAERKKKESEPKESSEPKQVDIAPWLKKKNPNKGNVASRETLDAQFTQQINEKKEKKERKQKEKALAGDTAADESSLQIDPEISRAYHKLEEIFQMPHDLNFSLYDAICPNKKCASLADILAQNTAEKQSEPHTRTRAVDVGASPGGWSHYLAHKMGIQVVAIGLFSALIACFTAASLVQCLCDRSC